VKKIKIDWILIGVIAVGLLLRIVLSSLAFHGDIVTQAGWGKWIYENGVKGFYENNVWLAKPSANYQLGVRDGVLFS
jgi:hypothetical protein